jgi:hypothetical protein
MTETTHSVRNSLIDRERLFRLGSDALLWSGAGGEGSLPYASVRDVRLIAYGSPAGETFQCTLRSRTHGKIKIRSHHYANLGLFEDRSATYTPFIRELATRIAAESPNARFLAGSTALWVVWLVIGLLGVGVAVLLILSLFDGVPPAGAGLIAVVICLAAVPLIWRRVREGSARTFDPAAPPPELIGDA